MAEGKIRVLLISARNLPGRNTMSSFVTVSHGSHGGSTHCVQRAGINPIFNTTFSFPYEFGIPIEFQVTDETSKKIICSGEKMIGTGKTHCPWVGEIEMKPQGRLNIRIEFTQAPKFPPPKATVTIGNGNDIRDPDFKEASVHIVLGNTKTKTTPFVRRNSRGVFIWDKVFEFDYSNEQHMSFQLIGKDNKSVTAEAQYDLWAMQTSQGLTSTMGELPVADCSNRIFARLSIKIFFWDPDNLSEKQASERRLELSKNIATDSSINRNQYYYDPVSPLAEYSDSSETGIQSTESAISIPIVQTSEAPVLELNTAHNELWEAAQKAVISAKLSSADARRASLAATAVADIYNNPRTQACAATAVSAADKGEHALKICQKELETLKHLNNETDVISCIKAINEWLKIVQRSKLISEVALKKGAAIQNTDSNNEETETKFLITLPSESPTYESHPIQYQKRTHFNTNIMIGSDSGIIQENEASLIREEAIEKEFSMCWNIPAISWRRPPSLSESRDTMVLYTPMGNEHTMCKNNMHCSHIKDVVAGNEPATIYCEDENIISIQGELATPGCCWFRWAHS